MKKPFRNQSEHHDHGNCGRGACPGVLTAILGYEKPEADGTDATGTTGTGGKRSADNTDADGDTGAYG